jgi:cysteine desulfurase
MDYSATNPCDPRVVDKPWCPGCVRALRQPGFAQPRLGLGGRKGRRKRPRAGGRPDRCRPARNRLDQRRHRIQQPGLKGAAHFYKGKGKHIITVKTEHKAVLDTCRDLERQGFEVTYLDVQADGLVNLDAFKAAIRPDTILASVMFVNNEIGVIQDIAAIGAICREKGVVFHVDAAQATGRVDIDLQTLPVDLMSLTSHKTYGPKGIGALYVRRKPRVRIEAQMHGGGHERGMRSGTLPTHQCVGMGEAYRIAKAEMAAELPRIQALHDRLLAGLKAIEEVFINGHATQRVPHNLNMSFNYVEGESLIMGIKGWRCLQRLGLHLGQPGAQLCAARPGPQRRTGPQQPAHDHRPLDHRRRNRLRRSPPSRTTWPSCANSPRCGRCTRTASTCPPSSGRRTERQLKEKHHGIQRKVVDHYENPRNVGSFDKGDDSVGTGMVGAPACGDVMKLQIKVNPPPA